MYSVLVVDDDSAVRTMLSVRVRDMGFSVREADTARRALHELSRQPSDIALCDVNMPGEDGVLLASRIRERHPQTAIVMATSGREVDTAVSSLQNDVVDYLLKPFDGARLREALLLGVDWHNASTGAHQFQQALEDRLRTRRTTVAATLAAAQESAANAVHGLLSMLELHLADSRGHATRVAALSLALADELGISDGLLLDLERAALLHDIGKLDMPSGILTKPAPLNDDEWTVMRTHPQVGYDLLTRLSGFAPAGEIVVAHHEAFDGSGYPNRLKGEEIPLGARILTVADSYDSMTHPHTQRPAMFPALAVSEIERCRGTQFDPDVAVALGRVLTEAASRRVH